MLQAQSMKICATGLRTRYFNVMIPIGLRPVGNSIGKAFGPGFTLACVNTEAGRMERNREHKRRTCSQGSDPNDSDCFHARRRSRPDRACGQPQPAGKNLTGIGLLSAETAAKRVGLLLQLVPKATSIGYLRNPTNPVYAEAETREVQIAANAQGVRLLIANASQLSEIETAIADLIQQRASALQVSSDGFLLTHAPKIVAVAHHALPAIYAWPQYAAAGGLMSYGTNIRNAWRQAGVYTGRILKGEKPADLPVMEVTKIDLVINLRTARMLGLDLPVALYAGANEIIDD